LSSYEGQNETWYGLENKKEEKQADTFDDETRWHPACSIAARHSAGH